MDVRFNQWLCRTRWDYYANARLGLWLVGTGASDSNLADGEPVASATVNHDLRFDLDEILVKNYAENHGMTLALINAGVVLEAWSPIYLGPYDSLCSRCRLTDAARREAFGRT